MRTALLVLLLSATAHAETPAADLVLSLDRHEQHFSRAELEKLHVTTAQWSVHGRTATVRGVPLDEVLVQAGFTPGPMGHDVPKAEKRSGWKKVLVASAADGFSAVFSCAELMPEMGPTRAMLVWEIDGGPIPGEEGPFRIVVLTDKEPSRSIYGVRRLVVVDMRALEGSR